MHRVIGSLIVIMLATWASIWGAEEDIIVKLDTEVSLIPLYLGTIIDEQSGFDRVYLDKLEKVLQFDLNNNGMTFLVKHNVQRDALAKPDYFDKPADGGSWWAFHVHYVVMSKVKDKKLSVRLFSSAANTLNAVNDRLLTGDLSQDRRTIHQLSDKIHTALFGMEGIASTRILYTIKKKQADNQWLSDIWEADYDGGNPRQITREGYCVTPAYIPPKQGYLSGGFFYVSYLNGQPKIFHVSLKEGIPQRFSYLRGNQLMPAISRQRDQVAFISDITGNPDLFIQEFNLETGSVGKPRQIFSSRPAVQGSPAFSPDGASIAFVSNKDGSPRIYVMDIPLLGAHLNELKPKLISKQCKESTAPAWSPDGTKLAYCALTNGTRQIWIYDFNEGKERQLTQGTGNKENPSWAPNSLHLVFNSTDAQDSELYILNLNQPKARKITTGLGEKHYPNWEAR